MSIARTREELSAKIAAIPAWRRFIICVWKRKEHRLARAWSSVTIDLLYENHEMTEWAWKRHDQAWARLYRITYLPTPEARPMGHTNQGD